MNATADGLASTLVESDNEGRVVASHPTSITENDASSTTLLEANFDHEGFSDGFTLHVPVHNFCVFPCSSSNSLLFFSSPSYLHQHFVYLSMYIMFDYEVEMQLIR